FYSGVELTKDRTWMFHYLVIMGSFMAVIATYLAFQLWGLRRRLGRGALLGIGTVVAPTSQGFVATADTGLQAGSRVSRPRSALVERAAGGIAIVGVAASG